MNPFKYGCVVSGEFLCPRPELERQLKSYIQSGQNIVVHGERRMGKTSLVRHVVSSMRGIRLLYIDLYCIRTLSDFCRRVLSGLAASNENMSFSKRRWASSIVSVHPYHSILQMVRLPFLLMLGQPKNQNHWKRSWA